MQLRFPMNNIAFWADRYSYPRLLRSGLVTAVRQQHYFTKPQLLEILRWKSPRSAPLAEANNKAFVVEVTRAAAATESEQMRIELLTLLKGVGWPVASCMLHFGISHSYPILDFRALWSLRVSVEASQYNYSMWRDYVARCRSIAAHANVTVRQLDMALWQYSKENQ
jgi:hypothetical protein